MAQQAPQQPVSDHYLTQSGLMLALEQAIQRVWPQVDVGNLAGTLPGFQQDMRVLIRQFSLSSAALAVRNYTRARREAGIGSSFTVRPASPAPAEQVDKAIGFATQGLYDRSLLEPTTSPADLKQALDNARTQVEGVSSRLVLNAGRETTADAVMSDRLAKGWARETRPGCCYFCAMLATRGAVYKDANTAGRSANKRFVGEGQFKFHNHCHCVAVPVFGQYEKTADARKWTREWHDLRRELGHSPSMYEWRRHYENRADGPKRGSEGTPGKRNPTEPSGQRLGFENLSRDQIQQQIGVLEGLKDSEYKRTQLDRLRKRLAELT